MTYLNGQSGEPKPSVDRHFTTLHLDADLGARTARSGAVMIVGQGVKFFITIVSTIVLARLLTPFDYGLIGMVFVVTGFVSLFKNLGFSAAIIQHAELRHEQVSVLFWINVLLSIGLTLITLVLAPLIARFYAEPRLTPITSLFAVGFLIGGLGAQHEALLRRQMRFTVLVSIEIVAMFCGVLVATILALKGAGVWALVFNQLVFVTLCSCGMWVFCLWRPGRPRRNSGVRPIIAFGRDLTGFNVLNYFTRNLDNLLIGKVWGAAQLGVYGKAYQLLLLPLDQVGVPLDAIAITSLSKLKSESTRYRKGFLRMLEKIAMVSMPFIAFMVMTSDWIVGLLLGRNWSSVAPIFAALGIMGLFEPIANTMGWLMISQGRSRDVLKWGIINSVITVSSFAIGLPWGGFGVALAFSLVGAFIRVPLLFWFVGRVGPVRTADIYRTIRGPISVAVGVVGALLLFRYFVKVESSVIALGLCLLIAIVLSAVLYQITPQGRSGIADFRAILHQLLTRRSPITQERA